MFFPNVNQDPYPRNLMVPGRMQGSNAQARGFGTAQYGAQGGNPALTDPYRGMPNMPGLTGGSPGPVRQGGDPGQGPGPGAHPNRPQYWGMDPNRLLQQGQNPGGPPVQGGPLGGGGLDMGDRSPLEHLLWWAQHGWNYNQKTGQFNQAPDAGGAGYPGGGGGGGGVQGGPVGGYPGPVPGPGGGQWDHNRHHGVPPGGGLGPGPQPGPPHEPMTPPAIPLVPSDGGTEPGRPGPVDTGTGGGEPGRPGAGGGGGGGDNGMFTADGMLNPGAIANLRHQYGLPLDAQFEAQRRQLVQSLNSGMSQLLAQRGLINGQYGLDTARQQTQEGLDNRSLVDQMAARGVAGSGIQNRQQGLLDNQYGRQTQDMGFQHAQQLGTLDNQQQQGQNDFTQGLMEAIMALIRRQAQTGGNAPKGK